MTIPTPIFDTIEVGHQYETGTATMPLNDVIEFANKYDPQPMHTDEKLAVDGPFGKLVASGWQTLCLTMRLMAERKPFGKHQLVGVGVDHIRFERPVEPETTIVVRAQVTAKRKSRKPGRGFVTMKVQTFDAGRNDVVATQTWSVMIPTD